MSHVPASSSAGSESLRSRESLDQRVEAAHAAHQQASPTDLIIVRVEAPVAAPEALLERFADLDGVLWHPPEGPRFAGIGVAHAITGRGHERFSAVKLAAKALWARTRGVPTQRGQWDSPRLFGGFAFSPDGANTDQWSSFGSARFVLPRVTYAVHEDRASLTLAVERRELDRRSSDAVQLFQRVYDVLHDNPSATSAPPATPETRREGDPRDFEQQVGALVERIHRGELQKVVAAREVALSFATSLDAVATLVGLSEQAPECLRFLFRSADAVFLGATPERLLRKRGRLLETEALAGSIDTGAESPERSLQASAKDLEEHALVVSAITQALAPVCDKPTLPDRPRVRRLKHLLHLCTPIQATLNHDAHVLELVARLHPTPAVGGVPTAAALECIALTESFDRGWYAGAVGWFDALGDGDFNVALRSGLVRAHQAWLYAGAGIVRESRAELEYAETTWKLSAMLSSLRARR